MDDLKPDALEVVKILQKRITTFPPILDNISLSARRRLSAQFLAPVAFCYFNEVEDPSLAVEYLEWLKHPEFGYDLFEESIREQTLTEAHNLKLPVDSKLVALGFYNTTYLDSSSAALLKVSFSAALAHSLTVASNTVQILDVFGKVLDGHDLLLLQS